MKKDSVNYLFVGTFVLAMLFLLLLVLFRLTGRSGGVEQYYVVYDNVAGVRKGSTVTYGGYQIGRVDDVKPRQQKGKTSYKLTLLIKEGWQIPADSVAAIVQPGMLSDNQIDISEGASKKMLRPGDVIDSENSVSILSLFKTLTDDIKPLLKNLNASLVAIGGDLDVKFPQITNNLNILLQNLNVTASQLAALTGNKNRKHLQRIIANADKVTGSFLLLSERYNDVAMKLLSLIESSNTLVDGSGPDIKQSVAELRNTLETVSENINSIVYNLETTSRNLNEASRQVRDNPAVLINGKPPADKAMVK